MALRARLADESLVMQAEAAPEVYVTGYRWTRDAPLAEPDKWRDFCAFCSLGGTLFCCEGGCYQAFHYQCLTARDRWRVATAAGEGEASTSASSRRRWSPCRPRLLLLALMERMLHVHLDFICSYSGAYFCCGKRRSLMRGSR